MCDNVELHLELGALLTASANMADYNADDAYAQNYGFPPEEWLGKHLIMAVRPLWETVAKFESSTEVTVINCSLT